LYVSEFVSNITRTGQIHCTRMLRGKSHELRTPLTRLRLRA
jgi:signal transduction histidine kinase